MLRCSASSPFIGSELLSVVVDAVRQQDGELSRRHWFLPRNVRKASPPECGDSADGERRGSGMPDTTTEPVTADLTRHPTIELGWLARGCVLARDAVGRDHPVDAGGG
jgi:hypothetical protein